MEELEKSCLIICLTASPEVILKRTKGSARPLLAVKDPLSRIKEMLNSREPFYKRCKFIIDTSNLSREIAAENIIKYLPNAN
jgi:shikimate kinase